MVTGATLPSSWQKWENKGAYEGKVGQVNRPLGTVTTLNIHLHAHRQSSYLGSDLSIFYLRPSQERENVMGDS